MSDIFVDREKELADLERFYRSCMIGGNCGVLIYGWRRVGKSFLVDKFLEGKIGFKINCSWISDPETFLLTVAEELKRINMSDLADKLFLKLREEKNPLILLRDTFDVLNSVADIAKRLPVFALDEIHIFIEKLSTRISRETRKSKDIARSDILWMLKDVIERKKAFWILISSVGWKKLQENLMVTNKIGGNPLLGVLLKYEVQPMDKRGIAELIKARSETVSEEEIDIIYRISGGIPPIADLIISMRRENENILDVAYKLLRNGAFDEFFENLIKFIAEVMKRDYGLVVRALKSFGDIRAETVEIARKLGMDRMSVYVILEDLYRCGLLAKKKEGRRVIYEIKYPLLKAWLEMRVEPRKSMYHVLASRFGITAEYYVRELLRKYRGKEIVLWDDETGTFLSGTIDKIQWKVLRVYDENEIAKLGVDADFLMRVRCENEEFNVLGEVKATLKNIESEEITKLARRVALLTEKTKEKVIGVLLLLGIGKPSIRCVTEAIRKGIIIITTEGIKMLAKKVNMPIFI